MSSPDDPSPPGDATSRTPSLFADPAAIAAADARALAEIAAERVVSHAAAILWMTRWGGADPWQPPPNDAPAAQAMPLVWTEGAIADLEHIRRYLTAFDPAAARRFATRVATLARSLEQEEAARPAGIDHIQTLRPFTIRYRLAAGELVIMWVRQTRDYIR